MRANKRKTEKGKERRTKCIGSDIREDLDEVIIDYEESTRCIVFVESGRARIRRFLVVD